ncbi:MAG TPA: MauE/DoxX family redox-associated membrane protein, partial [Actinomycetota bacterium]
APLVALRVGDREDGRSLVERLSGMPDRARSTANGVAIVAVGGAAVGIAWSRQGGWGEAAAAGLAVAFAWAAATKVVSARRWRRALAGHALPGPMEWSAVWAVPVVELLVPVLAIAGRERTAAAVALAALGVFTAALVRAGLREGVDVPCGCFGRESVDLRAALARNAVLVALAIVAWSTAPPDPTISFPRGPELLPAALAAGAALAAALTAWRATAWFSRGRG